MAKTKKVTITLLESMKSHTDNVSGYLTELAERAERRQLLRDELDQVMLLLEQAERDGVDLAMSAATIIEVSHDGLDHARLNWLSSQVRVEPVSKESARRSVGPWGMRVCTGTSTPSMPWSPRWPSGCRGRSWS